MKRLRVKAKMGGKEREGYVEGTGNGYATVYILELRSLYSIAFPLIEVIGYEEV